MPTASAPFNWRGFWADLLSGAGRGLLELDGSREAEAALSGLDYFTAMQRRRRLERQAAAEGDDRADEAEAYDPGKPPEQSDGVADPQAAHDRAPGGYDQVIAAGGLPPRTRPAPLSADPYDHPGLPVALRLGLRGYIRRR